MVKKITRSHTPRKRNNSLSQGKFEYEIEEFDWDKFKQLPYAKFYVEKVYETHARELARRVEDARDYKLSKHDYETMEAVILNSSSIKEKDISEWFDKQDWNVIDGVKGNTSAKINLKKWLSRLAHGNINEDQMEKARKLALKMIEALREDSKSTNLVLEYLWFKLTTDVKDSSLLDEIDKLLKR